MEARGRKFIKDGKSLMEIIFAKTYGFCYGVKRAVEIAEEVAGTENDIFTYGPLIHNPQFVEELARKGVSCKEDLNDYHKGDTVIIRSHGVGPEVYDKIKELDLKLIDATCPNVKMAQEKARQADEDGFLPIIIGEKNHPEVKSILAWAGKKAIVVECNKDIHFIKKAEKYAIIIQTTFELSKFEELLKEIQTVHPGEYRVERTICLATAQRQKAAIELAQKVDAVVVVGGKNSANTRHLYDLVKEYTKIAYHIETANELKKEMFVGCEKIGVTAGASTPNRIIKEAVKAMENMEMNEFEKMLDESLEGVEVYPGKLVKGVVIMKDREGAYVDFGYMREGMIAWGEWAGVANKDISAENVQLGDEVEAVVVPSSSKEEFIRLSRVRAEREAAWKDVAELAEGEKRPCTVQVLRVIKPRSKDRDRKPTVVGLGVAVEGVEGFMPASHIELSRIEDFSVYVGKELEAEIIEVNLPKKRIVVSRRDILKGEKQARYEEKGARMAAAKEARAAKEEAAYNSVTEGEIYDGKVTKVADFGLFVEIGDGLVGLVHNTELSYDRQAKASDVAKEGDTVKVRVNKIDRENRRVSLSIKATMEDPWIKAAEQFAEGAIIEGKIEKLFPFGAIVKLSDNVEGMIHISEIKPERVEKIEEVLTVGDTVKAKIIKKDVGQRKISLSISKLVEDN